MDLSIWGSLALFWGEGLVSGEQEQEARAKEEGDAGCVSDSAPSVAPSAEPVALSPRLIQSWGQSQPPPFLAPDAALSLGVLPKLCPHLYSILPN